MKMAILTGSLEKTREKIGDEISKSTWVGWAWAWLV